MQFIKIKKIETSSFSIDWETVDSFSLEEKMDYFVKLAAAIVGEKVTDPVEIGPYFRINKKDEKVFYTCFDEYFSCLKKLNNQAFQKKIADIASNFLPKKVYNALKNNDLPSFGRRIYQTITFSLQKQKLKKSVVIGVFAMAVLGVGFKAVKSVSASSSMSPNIQTGNNIPSSNFLQMTSNKVDMVSVEGKPLNSGAFSVAHSLIEEEIPFPEEELNFSEEETSELLTETLSASTEVESSLEEEEVETGMTPEAGERVAIAPESNYIIVAGYHYTTANITYDVTEEEYNKIVSAVYKTSNGTYEDALGIISFILNRMEDPRFQEQDLMNIIYNYPFFRRNTSRANAFANSKCPEEVWSAVYDAMYLGIRNNDYTEVEEATSSDYTIDGEIKYQIVPGGNKYYNLAINLGRADFYEAQLEMSETESEPVLSFEPKE